MAQETFLKAYGALDQLSNPEKLRSWLLGIAYRSFLDDARKNKRRRALAQEFIQERPASAPAGQTLDVERAMDNLPADCRAVVLLCLLHGMTQAEAAQATGMPLGTVKSHVARGKTKLRAILSDYAPLKTPAGKSGKALA